MLPFSFSFHSTDLPGDVTSQDIEDDQTEREHTRQELRDNHAEDTRNDSNE